MSRIYFHTPEARAEIYGSERAYMSRLIRQLFQACLNIPSYPKPIDRFFNLIPDDSYLKNHWEMIERDWLKFEYYLGLWMSSLTSEVHFSAGGERIKVWPAQLDTAILVGTDPIKLAARLDGQCEIHCYCEAENREWLAQIIESGLNASIYRREQGWESVIELLRNGCNSPVVTSYSICDAFPGCTIDDIEEWESLTDEEQWELSMEELRRDPFMELTPTNWDKYYFSGWDAFKINQLLEKPVDQWGRIARRFREIQLPAIEAWQQAIDETP